MKLTDNQERILKDNMGLVGKVIKDKVHNPNDIPGYAYEALILSVKGYTSKDIGESFGKTTNTITALMSKARKYLCKN